jgi:hypothetical protein
MSIEGNDGSTRRSTSESQECAIVRKLPKQWGIAKRGIASSRNSREQVNPNNAELFLMLFAQNLGKGGGGTSVCGKVSLKAFHL